ncbi:hypothetical protein DFH09DRAFT_1318874 [Mycena vulgaris]|nr:hypothetical protein DFH09DRAFT_1318874 [Mycena vulgaris]
MQEFPQELVDLIIDDVAGTPNTPDIRTCGGVCRQWLPRSRMHLFSALTLSNADPAAIQAFLNIVDASSFQILSLVQSLEIDLANGAFGHRLQIPHPLRVALIQLKICGQVGHAYIGYCLRPQPAAHAGHRVASRDRSLV